jgi:hypothetical protein
LREHPSPARNPSRNSSRICTYKNTRKCSFHRTSNPAESTLTGSSPVNPLYSALTRNMGVGGTQCQIVTKFENIANDSDINALESQKFMVLSPENLHATFKPSTRSAWRDRTPRRDGDSNLEQRRKRRKHHRAQGKGMNEYRGNLEPTLTPESRKGRNNFVHSGNCGRDTTASAESRQGRHSGGK